MRSLLPAALLLLCGCVTPVVVDSDGLRIGLFAVTSRSFNSAADYRRVTGVGAALGGRGFRVGYMDTQELYIEMTEEGVDVETPFVDVWTGQKAENYIP